VRDEQLPSCLGCKGEIFRPSSFHHLALKIGREVSVPREQSFRIGLAGLYQAETILVKKATF